MADPDLQIRGEGGGPPDPDPGLQKVCFRPFGPQFGLKIRGGGAEPPEPLLWIRHWFYQEAARLSCSFLQGVKKK